MIKPTVGRVVWFREYVLGKQTHNEPLAATVAWVNEDDTVNLTVHSESGTTYGITDIPLIQDDLKPNCDYCEWMPWQLGQAKAATESGEAK